MKFIHRLFLPFENSWNPWGSISLRASLLLALWLSLSVSDSETSVSWFEPQVKMTTVWLQVNCKFIRRGQREGLAPLSLATVLATCSEKF